MDACDPTATGALRSLADQCRAWVVLLAGAAGGALALAGAAKAAEVEDDAAPVAAGCAIDDEQLLANGAVIREIVVENLNIFDTDDPAEDKALFRLMNRLHVRTRASVIHEQLLFEQGQPFDRKRLEETERLLRTTSYLYDAEIMVVACEDDAVDVLVRTQDLWTLQPGIYLSRSGGETRTGVEIEDENFLGRGGSVLLGYRQDEERTSLRLGYSDRNLGGRWLSLATTVEDNSDGHVFAFSLERPFYSLDTRRAGGGRLRDEKSEQQVFSLGKKVGRFTQDVGLVDVFFGASDGLRDGWVTRWRGGLVYDDREFGNAADSLEPALVPENRRLIYPYIGYDLIENRYLQVANLDQIHRTEDVPVGAEFRLRLGMLAPGLGADRSGIIFSGAARRGFGDPGRVFWDLEAHTDGRVESGNLRNAIIGGAVRWYLRQSERRLLFATLFGDVSEELDLDNPLEIGGDTGLRGYPLRYQRGDARAHFTLEQRYFTDYYLWRVFRVGGAAFFDAGRVWGNNPYGGENLGLLTDVGLGLRLGNTRSSIGRMIHIDVAFPLNGDSSIDSVQLLLSGKRSF
jgi:hypothetical protein